MNLMHILRHLSATPLLTRRRFSARVLDNIEAAIRDVETKHAGEVRFAVETSFDLSELWHGVTPRQRALQVFGHLGVWDTENNSGVLIYVMMADHDVEIVADRGIAARVSNEQWQVVCEQMRSHFAAGRFEEGSVVGVKQIGELLATHFPNDGGDRNELSDRPVLL